MHKKFAFITDAHLNQKLVHSNQFDSDKMSYETAQGAHLSHLEKILLDIKQKNISQIIFCGDIGTVEANKAFFELIEKENFNLDFIMGNHDKYSEVKKYYHQKSAAQNSLDYTKEDDFFKYIYLDSSANILSNAQLAWLSAELKTTKKIIVFLHHPVLEIKTPLDKVGAALRNRDEVAALSQNISNEIHIFCGHYHMNDETVKANIHQYCSIAASYEIEKNAKNIHTDENHFGYRIIEIAGDSVKTETINFS